MKILFLTSRLPYPLYGGDRLTPYKFIEHLARKHEVHLLTFIESKDQERFVPKVESTGAGVETIYLPRWVSYLRCALSLVRSAPFQVCYYLSNRMRRAVRDQVRTLRPDLVICHLIRMAPYALPITECKRIIIVADAISLSLKRSLPYRGPLMRVMASLEYRKVKASEIEALQAFDAATVASDLDRQVLLEAVPEARLSVVTNGVDLEYFQPGSDLYDPYQCVFVGNMHAYPNQDAVRWFAKDLLPLVRKRVPAAEFHIVGAYGPPDLQVLEQFPGVHIVGQVDDLRSVVRSAAVSVCPMRIGAGIQNKNLEAMAMGVPVVTTTFGYEGIQAEKGKEILVADDWDDFASAVAEMMLDRQRREHVAQAGRRFVEDHFRWETQLANLDQVVKSVFNSD